jgi:hypothetical protein
MSAAERVEEVDAFGAARMQFAGMEKRLTSPDMLTASTASSKSTSSSKGANCSGCCFRRTWTFEPLWSNEPK